MATSSDWYGEDEIVNEAAEAEAREEKIAPIAELHMVRHPGVARDVAERRLRRSLTPPRLVKFKVPLVGTSFELGNILLVTHFSGVSATGWVTRPIRVHRVDVDPDTNAVEIEGYDMKQIVDILTTGGTGGGTSGQGAPGTTGDSWAYGLMDQAVRTLTVVAMAVRRRIPRVFMRGTMVGSAGTPATLLGTIDRTPDGMARMPVFIRKVMPTSTGSASASGPMLDN